MKKSIIMLVVAMFCSTVTFAQADLRAIRNELKQTAKEEMDAKVSRDVKKQAKEFKKAGWQITPGALPIPKQLERSQRMQFEQDVDGELRWVVGEGMDVGSTYEAAKTAASVHARASIAGQIQTELTSLIEDAEKNQQISSEEAASMTSTTANSKALISQTIGRTVTATEVYRKQKNGNFEVLVRLAYDYKTAKKAAVNALKKEFLEKGINVPSNMDEMFK